MEPRKNIRLLISAFLNIQDDYPDLYPVLCGRTGWNLKEVFGDDPAVYMRRQTKNHCSNTLRSIGHDQQDDLWDNRIIVTGFVEDEDLPLIYQKAEWFVFPSKYEGFGIPPLEAMGMGCPVLSSDVSALPEVLGDAAVYSIIENEDLLCKHLRTILSMGRENRAELIKMGTKQAFNYSWENSVEVFHLVLKNSYERRESISHLIRTPSTFY